MKLPSDCWNLARALDGVGGDEIFLSELAGIFCAAYPTLLNDLKQSIAAKNYLRVADAAHLLGHAARNIAATKVMKAALVIETMARRLEFDDIDNAFCTLQLEGGQLLDAVADFRRERAASTHSGGLVSHANTRQAPRFCFVADIELTDVQSGTQVRGQTKNLSLFGCAVGTFHSLPTGTTLRIKLSREGTSMVAIGRAVYARPDLGIGIVFTSVEPEDEWILDGWITELMRSPI